MENSFICVDMPIVTIRCSSFEYIQRSTWAYKLAANLDDATKWECFISGSPVLAAWSRWDTNLAEHEKDVFSMADCDREVAKRVENYLCGEKTLIHNELCIIIDILRVADMFLISDLKNYCISRICNTAVNDDTCFDILEASSIYEFEHPEMHQYFRGHLTSLLTLSEKAYNLSFDTLLYLLEDEELSYWPEQDRLRFVMTWCNKQQDRENKFAELFDYINLKRMNKAFLEYAMKTEKLIHESPTVAEKVNKVLSEEEKEQVPFVFLAGHGLDGSNLIGFNLEDHKMYRFTTRHRISSSQSLVTFNNKGNVIFFERGLLHECDICTGFCDEKHVQLNKKMFQDIHIVLANESIFMFGRKILHNNQTFAWKRVGYKTGSTLFEVELGSNQFADLKPLLSFRFEVNCACLYQSKVYMASSSYSHSGQVFCYDLCTYLITVTFDIKHKNRHAFQFRINHIIPVQDHLLLVTTDNLKIIKLPNVVGNKGDILMEVALSSASLQIAYCPGTICEVNTNSIRIIKQAFDDLYNAQQEVAEYRPEHVPSFLTNFALCGSLKATTSLCHIMCPHCDPKAWEKEVARLEEERQRLESISFVHDYDDDDVYYDNDDYDNDGWNDGPEKVWIGSADEFVDAWW